MAGQDYIVGLRFTADTTAARQQLEGLKSTLMGLNNFSNIDFAKSGLTTGIQEATSAAAQLRVQLEAATNVKTGNLDLTKFNRSLRESGMTLEQYKTQLERLGPEGQKAFYQLAGSIQSAEVPLVKMNKLFGGLWENLKRTAGWQISSSVIHGFMSSVQKAFNYAEDLNKSLNDIRIVTGASVDKMSQFAETANRAAKALSTSTNEYVKASLIYYQQGLDDEAVKERTDITVKMANVTGQTAETVSDQMTAVWNNFAKGSENLESYTDKMVALGAATASSSDEIARGLEKFAAVADTVGLSFDYAAAALATITATTRQSADTVGTALKTLFARLEGLKLGETLDDGTDLNKYSAALASVGVNIKDANGELKKMDTILDETMVKWKTLSKDQQVALAQTVAGVRQYTQFVALMDNADFFKENLTTEANSAGALQNQADIYAESWEGAQKRVKASIEDIYNSLINDEFFIKLTNNIAKIVDGIGLFIKSIGGAKGVLAGLTALIFRLFSNQLADGIRNITFSVQNLISGGKQALALKQQMSQLAQEKWGNEINSEASMAMGEGYRRIADLQAIIASRADQMSQAELRQNQLLIDRQKYLEDAIQKQAQLVDSLREEARVQQEVIREQIEATDYTYQGTEGGDRLKTLFGLKDAAGNDQVLLDSTAAGGMANIVKSTLDSSTLTKIGIDDSMGDITILEKVAEAAQAGKLSLEEYQNILAAVTTSLDGYSQAQGQMIAAQDQLDSVLKDETATWQDVEAAQEAAIAAEEAMITAAGKAGVFIDRNVKATQRMTEAEWKAARAETDGGKISAQRTKQLQSQESIRRRGTATIGRYTKAISKDTKAENENRKALTDHAKAQQNAGKQTSILSRMQASASKQFQNFKNAVSQATVKIADYAAHAVKVVQGVSQVTMGLSSLFNIVDTWRDPDTSFWEKLGSTLMSLGMGLPMVINGFKTLKPEILGVGQAIVAHNAAEEVFLASKDAEIAKMTLSTALHKLKTGAIQGEEAEQVKAAVINTIANELAQDENGNLTKNIVLKNGKTIATAGESAATAAQNILQAILNGELTITNALLLIFKTKLGAVLVVILAVVAAIAALAAIIAVVVYALGTGEREMEKAANTTKEAGEAAKNSADRYKDLKTSIDSLKDARKTLDGLKEGTTEWYEAVAEVNSQVIELLKKYPMLKDYIENVNGVLNIKDEGLSAVMTSQLIGTYAANRQYQSAQIAEQRVKRAHGEEPVMGSERQLASFMAKNMHSNYSSGSLGEMTQESSSSLAAQLTDIIRKGGTVDKDTLKQTIIDGGWFSGYTLNSNDVEKYYDQILPILQAIQSDVAVQTEQDIQNVKGLLEFVDPEKAKGRSEANIEAIKTFAATDRVKTEQQTGDGYGYNGRTGRLAETAYVKSLEQQGYALGFTSGDRTTITGQLLGATSNSATKNKIAYDWEKMHNDAQDGYQYYTEDTGGAAFTAYREDAEGNRQYYQSDGSWGDKKSTDNVTYNNDLLEQLVAYGDHITDADIEAYNKYKAAMEGVTQQFKKGEITVDEYTAALKANGQYTEAQANAYIADVGLSNKVASEQKINGLVNTTGLSSDELHGFVDSLSEEELTLFAQFEFDENSKQNFYEQYDRFKSEFEESQKENAIQLQGELGVSEGLDQEEVTDYVTNIMDLAEESDILEDSLKDDAEAAGVVAKSVMHMNDGIEELAKNQEEWLSVLKSSDKSSEEFTRALSGIRKAMGKILDIDTSYLSKDFLTNTENLELMEKAAEGDADAIDELKAKLKDEVIMKVIADNKIENSEELLAKHEALKNDLESRNIQVGATLDDTAFLNAAQEIIETAGMTVEQAQAYFDSLGYEAEIEPVEEDMTTTNVHYEQIPVISFVKADIEGLGTIGDMLSGHIKVPQISYRNGEQIKTDDTTAVQAASIGPAGKTAKPKIKGITKKATGSLNNASTANPGGKSSGGGGSGGGGGGSEKKSKKLEDEIDRYHEINEVLDDLSKKLDKINTVKDRAFGGKHVAAIEAEIAALEEEGVALDEKIRQAENYLQEDASRLNAYGAIYDEQGRVTNYNDIIANAVAAYNTGSIDDDEFSYIKECLSKYEDSLNTLEDETEKKAENVRKKLDAQFEKVEYKIEIQLDINDKERNYLDWQLKHLEDKEFGSAERMAKNAQKADLAQDDWDTNQQGIRGILEVAGATSKQIDEYFAGNIDSIKNLDNLTQQAIEDLGNYTQGLMDSYDALKEAKQAIEEELTRSWEEYNEKLEDTMSIYDHLTAKVEHYQNIVDLAGKRALGVTNETMRLMRQQQIEISRGSAESLRDQLAYNQAANDAANDKLKAIQAEYDAADDERKKALEDDKKYWEEQVKTTKDKVNEIQESLWETEEAIIEGLKEDWEATVNEMMDEFEESLSGAYRSFDELSEVFDQQKTLASQYLPDYQKLYELSKLNRQLNKDLEKVDSTKGKQKLKDLQEEINALQEEGVQMSQYDLEYLQKKYDLKMAEIALEDAQDAKNMVRLRRDANGNYGYVYTADEDKTQDAVQNYEDKLYAAQDLTEKYMTEMGEQYIATLQEMSEAIRAIQVDDYASYEEYQQKVDQVRNYYTQRLKYFSDEVDGALANNIDLYNTDYLEYESKAGMKEERGRAFVTHFSETVIGSVIGEYDRLGEHYDLVLEQLGSVSDGSGVLGKMATEYTAYRDQVAIDLEQAGLDVEKYNTKVKEEMDKVQVEVDETKQKTDELATAGTIAYQKLSDSVAAAQEQISPKLADLEKETKAATEAHLALLTALKTKIEDPHNIVTTEHVTVNTIVTKYVGGSGSGDGSGGGGNTGGTGGYVGGGDGYWTYKIFINGAEKYSGTGASQSAVTSTAKSVADSNNLMLSGAQVYQSQRLVTYNGYFKRASGGCFDAKTQILMADNTSKNIEDICIGDMVIAYDELTQQYISAPVTDILIHHNTVEMLDVYFTNGIHLGLTACHPILTTEGWKSLNQEIALFEHHILTSNLMINQTALGFKEKYKIEKIIWRPDKLNYDTYNITVPKYHTYIANNIIVHNAQVKLAWNTGGYTGSWHGPDSNPLVSAATGMYTGEWGAEGRLAVLHEKELVLNKHDTTNMLSTIELVRKLTQDIDLQTSAQKGMLISRVNNNTTQMGNSAMSNIEQHVSINADFPNTIDRNEISAAFNQLMDQSLQYTYRNNY